MKKQIFSTVLLLFLCTGCATPPSAEKTSSVGRMPDKSCESKPVSEQTEVSSQKASAVPVIHLPEGVHEFSAVPDGTIVSHDFVIKNTGGAVLTLSRISAG